MTTRGDGWKAYAEVQKEKMEIKKMSNLEGNPWVIGATAICPPHTYVEKTTKQLFIEGIIDSKECEARLRREAEYERMNNIIHG